MKIKLKHVAAALAVGSGLMAPALASAAVVTSTVVQTSNGTQQTNASQTALIGTFSFANPAATLADLTGVQITLTINDGDTGWLSNQSHDFDWGNLFLTLDGYDTGLILNGFRNGQTDTQTIALSGLNLLNASGIYGALIADNQLVARVADVDGDVGGDNNGAGGDNQLKFPKNSVATLQLAGNAPVVVNADAVNVSAVNTNTVPEPGSLALIGLGVVGLVASRRRKRV